MRTILLISLLSLLSSCAIKPPDGPVCRPLNAKRIVTKDPFGIPVEKIRPNPVCIAEIGEPECGRCTWTISDRVKFIGESEDHHLYGKPWSLIKIEAVIMPSEYFAGLKSYIVKSCKELKCDDQIPRWRIKVDSIDSVGDLIASPAP